MATLALGAAGASIGGPAGQAIGAALGSYIDNEFIFPALFPQDPLEGPRIGDLRVQGADEGAPMSRLFGAENRVAGTIIWLSQLHEDESLDSGGKGGGGAPAQLTYTYSVDVAVSFCEGPPDGNGIVQFTRIFTNTKTLYQEEPDKSAEATTLTCVAETFYRTFGFGETQATVVDFYQLTITSPDGGPDLSIFKTGKDVEIDGWTETANNDTVRVVSSAIDEGTGISTLVVKRKDATFVTDANGAANLIALFQDLPQFNPNKIESVTTYLGTDAQAADTTIQAVETLVPAYRDVAYVLFKGLQLADSSNQLPNFNAEVWATGTTDYEGMDPETVGGILNKLLAYAQQEDSDFAGLTSLSFDTTAVDAIPVRGYAVRGPAPIRSVIQPLLLAFDVTAQEANGTVTFIERKNATEVPIVPDDLAAHARGADAPRAFEVFDRRGQVLPKEVTVNYIEPEKRYQSGSVKARKLSSATGDTRTVEIPIVMDGAQARDIAERILWTQHANRRGIKLSLPPSYAIIQENDVLTWTDPVTAKAWKVRAQVVDRGVNGLVLVEGTEEVDALLAFASVIDPPTPPKTPDDPYTAPELLLRMIDVAAFRDEDTETPGVYYAVSAADAGTLWPAASLFRSIDGGTVYELRENTLEEASQGFATTELGTVPCPWLWDRANTVRVSIGVQLSSRTEDEVLEGVNRILIGKEVVGFATATLVSADVYDLTDLLRGLLGTEEQVGLHSANEEAVLLTGPGIKFLPFPLASLGIEWHYKAVPFGGNEADFEGDPFTAEANNVLPLAVAHLGGVRETNLDWTLSWTRRTRAFIDPLRSDLIPLHEDSESYEVEVRNVGTGAVIATYTSTSPSLVYTEAQQIVDFGSAQASIRVAVFQISSRVGRGKPTEEIL